MDAARKVNITDIHCNKCGAPARFDIVRQQYVCGYCGGTVGIKEAIEQKKYFRQIHSEKMKTSVKQYDFAEASCTGCGATLVFNKNEAISNCAFCGRSLVRKDYLYAGEMPESVIPFVLTEAEAKARLAEWCQENKSKPEAKHLLESIDELQGFYLPYELVRGPAHLRMSRIDRGSIYTAEGFINDEFVNRSKQLDNLLLDAMEPFDYNGLAEFEFAYVAGHKVKISDISDKSLEERVSAEASESYTMAARNLLETKAVDVSANVDDAVRLPVLLPVYYICKGELMAAVNGQTGKVSVRAEKESKYYFLPWWFKSILATAVFCLASYIAFVLFGMAKGESLLYTGILGVFFIIVNLCLYSDTKKNKFSVDAGRRIFTSGDSVFTRSEGQLVPSKETLERRVASPMFFMNIGGQYQPVMLRFTTAWRIIRMMLISVVALFLPVICALLVNGFDFGALHLGGSAVWFCIMVPVIPIYILKLGIVELYEKPWIYTVSGQKWKRYRQKMNPTDRKNLTKGILRAVFVPPISLAVWFGIASFITMVYLTAGYGW